MRDSCPRMWQTGRMLRDDAKRRVGEMLAPIPYDLFFEQVLERRAFVHGESGRGDRAALIGTDPKATILGRFADFSTSMTYHAQAPTGPVPERREAESPEDFASIVESFHERDYTVRIHDVSGLSPELDAFIRALEVLLEVPVDVMIFWSAAGGRAPVHHDRSDILCIQLMGRKRWFISKTPPTLPNPWHAAGESVPELGAVETSEVGSGDMLYMPRGTAHTVESLSESIHLSIGFTPVTLRDGVAAILDHMADMNIPMRAGLLSRADGLSTGAGGAEMEAKLANAVHALKTCLENADFVETALQRRRARMVRELDRLPTQDSASGMIGPDTVLERQPLAVSEMVVTGERLDLSLPGETVLLHPGVESSVAYMTSEPRFRLRDVPGEIGDDVRVELARMLVKNGFLGVGDAAG